MEKDDSHSNVTERAILGGILKNEENYDKVSPYLKDINVLCEDECRLLWGKFKELKENKIQIDLISVCNTLNKEDKLLGLTQDFIISCSEIESLETRTESYASQLYEKYLLRKIINKSKEILNNFPLFGLKTIAYSVLMIYWCVILLGTFVL